MCVIIVFVLVTGLHRFAICVTSCIRFHMEKWTKFYPREAKEKTTRCCLDLKLRLLTWTKKNE